METEIKIVPKNQGNFLLSCVSKKWTAHYHLRSGHVCSFTHHSPPTQRGWVHSVVTSNLNCAHTAPSETTNHPTRQTANLWDTTFYPSCSLLPVYERRKKKMKRKTANRLQTHRTCEQQKRGGRSSLFQKLHSLTWFWWPSVFFFFFLWRIPKCVSEDTRAFAPQTRCR